MVPGTTLLMEYRTDRLLLCLCDNLMALHQRIVRTAQKRLPKTKMPPQKQFIFEKEKYGS